MKISRKVLITVLLTVFFFISLNQKNVSAQWVQMSSGIGNNESCFAIASSGTSVIAGMASIGIYRSTNNGVNWTSTSLNNQSIFTLYVSGGTVYAGTSNGIYTSVNNGANWTQSYLAGEGVGSILTNGGFMFAGGTGVRVSSNGGASWIQYLATYNIKALAVSGATIFAAATSSGVWKSTNNGTNWTLSLSGTDPLTFLVSGANVYVSTSFSGLQMTSNSGTNWTQVSVTMNYANSILNQDTYYISGRDLNLGVYLSSNGGSTWLERNQGFGVAPYTVLALCFHNTYVFAGTFGGSVWRRGYSELLSPAGVELINSNVPENYFLSQNYPNPFNPSTKINYKIKSSGVVSLKVFDLLGKEVAALINEKQNAGSYAVDFNSAEFNLPSGIYFYTLNAGEFKETKKMVLVK